MKRLLIGVGIAMSAIAIVAAVSGGAGTASAEGPTMELDGLEQLSGVEFGDLSDLPAEPQPAAEPANPAPASPIEQPAPDTGGSPGSSPGPAVTLTDTGPQPAVPAGAAAPLTLPSTGMGVGDKDGMLVIAGLAVAFALAGIACLGGARAIETARAQNC
jgi:hypothetical protein